MSGEAGPGRDYGEVYRVAGRADMHRFLVEAVEAAGARLLFATPSNRAPVFLGIQLDEDERIGVLCYPFRATQRSTRNRPVDEHRLQVRYGAERSWLREHRLGRDLAGVDTTVVLGVHLEVDLFLGLDPARYDPLPMGISIEFKDAEVRPAQRSGWHVWERENRAGARRAVPRSPEGLEAVVAFSPPRLIDYLRFERRATALGLDPPLRFSAAQIVATDPVGSPGGMHTLEAEFELTSRQIMEIVARRARLSVAVKGGVAEFHLERFLRASPEVRGVDQVDLDGVDFEVELRTGQRVRVECKNVSPNPYADGSTKLEVQKTRSQRDNPAGRFYRPNQFDVLAACLFSRTGIWEFRFKSSARLDRHTKHLDRLTVFHRVDDTWSETLGDALSTR